MWNVIKHKKLLKTATKMDKITARIRDRAIQAATADRHSLGKWHEGHSGRWFSACSKCGREAWVDNYTYGGCAITRPCNREIA